MIDLNETLLSRNSPCIAAIAFGSKYAKGTIEEMRRIGCYVKETVLLGNSSSIEELIVDVLRSDLLYIVIDSDEMTTRNLKIVERIISYSKALAVGICIGEVSSKDTHKFETLTKAFYFPVEDRIEKYIALIVNMIDKALQPEALVRIDLSDLRMCLKGKTNRVWFGKAYGKEKGYDIANRFKKSDWYKNMLFYSCDAVLVILAGDISLLDANDTLVSISGILTRDALSLISVSYDGDVYEEMSMMVIDSK